jgi:uncharacterized protein
MAIERSIGYFEQHGEANTDETLRLAAQRAQELSIRSVVVASYTGATGVKAVEVFTGCTVVVVGGTYGFEEPNQVGMQEENRRKIEEGGGKVLFAGHSFGMIGRAVRKKMGAIQVDEIIANVLRLFSQGTKVACEVSCMAADAGLIRAGEECIAIGGSESGADTALVLKATNTHAFFDIHVCEVICKPR